MTKKENFKIKEITEIEEHKFNNETYDGYSIIIYSEDKLKKIDILISDYQSCCEDWGYICSEDNFDDFIGSKVIEIYTTGIEGETSIKDYMTSKYIDEDEIMFLTLKTSKGNLQFAVYNSHNGYYGHQAIIKINDEIIEDEIL